MHYSQSSKGQVDQHKCTAERKSLFRCCLEEILGRQLIIIRSWAFAAFSAIEKALAGRMLCTAGLHCIVQIESLVQILFSSYSVTYSIASHSANTSEEIEFFVEFRICLVWESRHNLPTLILYWTFDF